MSDVPPTVAASRIWERLSQDDVLLHALIQLRSNAEVVATKVAEVEPGFTDHSVKHMDALWVVADAVLTDAETEQFTPGEAFVLGCSFYIHDLGMAIAATAEGRASLEGSAAYRSCFARLSAAEGCDTEHARSIALEVSARDLHASRARTLIDEIIPGLDRYLLEVKDLRDQWGDHIGRISESHHWSVSQVDAELGSAGRSPGARGHSLDLGYLACVLRIVDYAHINAERAPSLERLLRADMPAESLVHWRAQEFITGPDRDGQYLAYASTRPIADVDAWWVFYEMASGLDREITAVADYLSGRVPSAGRFSLEGVKGVKSPTAFSKYVRPGEFSPVDIRFRPDSMTRLVDLLGGKQLYGNDRFAPLRELLQNARDAIHLRRAVDSSGSDEAKSDQIDVKLEAHAQGARLSVSDNGVGMSARTVTSYLLGIASHFWSSQDFAGEYPTAISGGFKPVGRFGIGFLSVFMFGDEVEVETQQMRGPNLTLRLHGVGKRGALIERASALRTGTTVRVAIPPAGQGDLEGLARIVQAKAPMLDIRIRIAEMDSVVHVEPEWWKRSSQAELSDFLTHRALTAAIPFREHRRADPLGRGVYARRYFRGRALSEVQESDKWPGNQPQVIDDGFRAIATPQLGRVTLCSKGFAVSDIELNGISGLVDVGELAVNAARSLPLDFDEEALRKRLLDALWPRIVEATNGLASEGVMPARFAFLHKLGTVYGKRLLADTTAPWIGVQQAPGETVLRNSAEVRELVSARSEVFVAYGTGPWGADMWLRSLHPDVRGPYLVLVVPTGSGPSVRSRYGQEPGRVEAPLTMHFVPDHVHDETEAESELHSAKLLLAVLACIAEAWGVSPEDLMAQGWARGRGNLVGRIQKGR